MDKIPLKKLKENNQPLIRRIKIITFEYKIKLEKIMRNKIIYLEENDKKEEARMRDYVEQELCF